MLTMLKVRMSTIDAKERKKINNSNDNDSDSNGAFTAQKNPFEIFIWYF